MTPATLLGVWVNLDDEAYLSAGLKARARDRLVEHRGVRRSHGHAGSTRRSSAARAGPLVTEVGPLGPTRGLEPDFGCGRDYSQFGEVPTNAGCLSPPTRSWRGRK